jgi:hypothetical protein
MKAVFKSRFSSDKQRTNQTQTNMKYQIIALISITAALSSCADSGLAANSQQGLLKRSSHASVPSSYKGKGDYAGRQYFNPPGSKTGVQWVDLYKQP